MNERGNEPRAMHGVLLQQLVVAPHPAPPSTKPSRNGEHIHRRPPGHLQSRGPVDNLAKETDVS